MRTMILLALGLLASCNTGGSAPNEVEPPPLPTARFWRGNLHTHSFWSDGDGFAELVLRDYRDAGYDFVALTDHDNIARHESVRTLTEIAERSCGRAYEDLVARTDFGETPAGAPPVAVQLRTIDSIAQELDEPNRFLVLRGEEISATSSGLRVHVGALLPSAVIRPISREDVPATIRANFSAAHDDNPDGLCILNHPNHDYAITIEDLASIEEIEFLEIFSGHRGVRTLGDGNHPSVERMWDVANALRIVQGWAPIFGIAADDAHDYYCDLDARPGRGYVQVRANRLSASALFASMRAGDFYASTGVDLRHLHYDGNGRVLEVTVEPEDGVHYVIEFIGTRVGFDASHTPRTPSSGFSRISDSYSAEIGQVLARVTGESARFVLDDDVLCVRAVVTSDRELNTTDNVYARQVAQAWTQPVGWESHRGPASGK